MSTLLCGHSLEFPRIEIPALKAYLSWLRILLLNMHILIEPYKLLGSNMDVNLCLQLAFIARVILFRQQHDKRLDFPSVSLSEQSIMSKIWSFIRQWLMSEFVQSTYGSSLSASIKVNSRTWNCITWDWDPRFILQPLTISCNIFTAAPFLIPRGCTVQLGYQKQNTDKYQSAEITIVNVTDKVLDDKTLLDAEHTMLSHTSLSDYRLHHSTET